jgi:hypothetical protein
MNIIRNKEYLKEKYGNDFVVMDDNLEYIDIFLLPHYGNLVCLEFYLHTYRHAIHNDTKNIGAILHNMCPILNLPEDGMRLRDLSMSYKSLRSVWLVDPDDSNGGCCVGIGNFYRDKFILFDEFHLAEV